MLKVAKLINQHEVQVSILDRFWEGLMHQHHLSKNNNVFAYHSILSQFFFFQKNALSLFISANIVGNNVKAIPLKF